MRHAVITQFCFLHFFYFFYLQAEAERDEHLSSWKSAQSTVDQLESMFDNLCVPKTYF